MNGSPDGVSHAPPATRHPRWLRAGALALTALIFWADTVTPLGIAVPALYVVPILFFMMGGEYWEPLLVAAGATLLIVAGAFLSPEGSLELGAANRPLEALTVWISAGVVSRYRRTLARWTVQYASDRAAGERTLSRLEELEQAIDQAAIVATTDQTGRITYVNEKFCQISKYSSSELIGQDHRIINSGYHSKEFMRDLWRTIAQGRVWRARSATVPRTAPSTGWIRRSCGFSTTAANGASTWRSAATLPSARRLRASGRAGGAVIEGGSTWQDIQPPSVR